VNVAIIPARGGSKRIPRKNIRDFNGRPMIAHAILAAKESSLFERVIVSTDDFDIADISIEWGAEVPFMRPADLAADHVPTVPVIAHAIRNCQSPLDMIDLVCCIYPCVPLIQIQDLSAARILLEVKKADYVFPITTYGHPVQRALRRSPDGRVTPFQSGDDESGTQDLESAFHDAGQFYWGMAEAWLSEKKIHTNGFGIVIPQWRVIDIDSPDDWFRAELIYRAIFQRENHDQL
jgi:pseudaminic acid cytidylyltransferase